jgi:hypothetical protein
MKGLRGVLVKCSGTATAIAEPHRILGNSRLGLSDVRVNPHLTGERLSNVRPGGDAPFARRRLLSGLIGARAAPKCKACADLTSLFGGDVP